MKKTCWLIVLCLMWSSLAAAETVIRFKSGKTLSGELLDRNAETIRIRFSGMELSFGMSEVASVDGQPVVAAPAVEEQVAAPEGNATPPAAVAEKAKTAGEPEPTPTPPPGARPGQTRPRGVDTPVKKEAPVKQPVVEGAAVPKAKAASEPAPSTPSAATVSPTEPEAQAGPAEVYSAYLDAVRAGDWERIKSYVTGEQIQQIESTFAKEGGVDQVVKMLQLMLPADLEIVAERVRGEDATILASGQVLDKVSRGAITLSRASGRWLIKKEEWKSDDTPLLQ